MMNRLSLSSRQLTTLSVYLDGKLTQKQQAKVEKQLAESPEMRQALKELRRTRYAVRQLKQKPVRRNFMLKPEMAGVRLKGSQSSRLVPALSFGSIAAAVMMVFTLVAGLLPLGMRAAEAPQDLAGAAPVIESATAPDEDVAFANPIITWGGGIDAVPEVVAMGGGIATGKGSGGGVGGGGAGGRGTSAEIIISAPPAVITNDSGVPGFAVIIPSETGEAVQAESREIEDAAPEASYKVIDSGPILGLRISEGVEKAAEPEHSPEPANRSAPAYLLPATIVFGLAAVLLAISAIMLKRKQ